MAVDAGTVVAKLLLNTNNFKTGLTDAQRAMQDTLGGAETLNGKITALGGGLSNVGKTMTIGFTAPLLGLGVAAVNTAGDFEYSLSKVRAVTGATAEDMKVLKDAAIELGSTTSFSATEAANGMEFLGQAGYDTTQIIAAMPGILDLAAASGTELAQTAEIVSSSMNAFGLSAEQSSHFADVLAQAAASSNANVVDLGEGFKYVAPVATAFGMTLEETTAALSLMANAGIKGGQGGTALRGALTRLINPSDEAAIAMKELGINIADAEGNMLPFQEIMKMTRAGMSGLTEEQKNQAMATIFGQEALSGMMAVVNSTDEEFGKLTDGLVNSDGAAAEMAATMKDNLKGSIDNFSSSIEGVVIALGDRLIPTIRSAVDTMNGWVVWFNNLSDAQKDQIAKIVMMVAALGPLLFIFGKLITFVATVGSAISTLGGLFGGAAVAAEGVAVGAGSAGGALALLTGPVGIVIGIIAGLIAIFVALYNNNEQFRNNMNMVWEQLKITLGAIWKSLGDLAIAVFGALQAFWDRWGADIVQIFKAVFDVIIGIVNGALGIVQGIITIFTGLIKGDWDMVWQGICQVFQGVWDIICTIVVNGLQFIWNLLSTGLQMWWDFWSWIWGGIVEITVAQWQAIWGVFTSVLQAIWDFLVAIFTAIGEFYTTATNAWIALFQMAWDAIVNAWNNAISFFINIGQGIGNAFNGVGDMIKGAFSSAVEYVSSLPEKFWEWGSHMVQGLADGIWATIDNVTEAASSVAEKIKEFLHFTRPDTGPLREYEQWMPHFMQGLAKGIRGNQGLVTNALTELTNGMTLGANISLPQVDAASQAFNGSFQNSNMQTNNIEVGGTVVIKVEGDGSENLNNAAFLGQVESTILQSIKTGNRSIPNRTSLIPIGD